MDESSVKIIRRNFIPDDKPFIFATWRNSAFYSVPRGTRPDSKKFFEEQTERIRQILLEAEVTIACLEDDPSTIIGYSVSRGTHLDWIYVKTEFRKMGIGTLLFPKDTETVTDQFTKIGKVIAKKKNLETYKEK